MLSRIPGLKTTSRCLIVFIGVFAFGSCGSSGSTSTQAERSGLRTRAFVSNPVHPVATGGGTPVLEIMDTSKDVLSFINIPLASISVNITGAGVMSLSPNRARTLVASPADSKLAVVDNVRETVSGAITLPGPSESFFVWTDNSSAFAAIPTAPVTGQAPGVVEKLDTTAGTVTATIPVPGAHYLVPSPNGNQILVFSDNSNNVTLITPSLIGSQGQPFVLAPCTTTQVAACTVPASFDRPVWGVFDPGGTTVYVMNCGPACGGTSAGVAVVNLAAISSGSSPLTANIPVPAASTALLQGTTLYVAGSAPGGASGTLSVLNLSGAASSVNCTASPASNCQLFTIAGGYQNRIEMGSNGQLFVGARACSSACLSIFDTTKSAVTLPGAMGDVTGIAPIPNRNVVYVCQGGVLIVYDTTTGKPAVIPNTGQPNIIGQAIDVKVIDF